MPLGMETGAIADRQISASSMHLGFMALQRWAPELARLHRSGIVNAWTASNYDRKPWIQVWRAWREGRGRGGMRVPAFGGRRGRAPQGVQVSSSRFLQVTCLSVEAAWGDLEWTGG